MSTDGEGTASALAEPTHGSEQERKRLTPEAKARRKQTLTWPLQKMSPSLRVPDEAVYSQPRAHSHLLYLLKLN